MYVEIGLCAKLPLEPAGKMLVSCSAASYRLGNEHQVVSR